MMKELITPVEKEPNHLQVYESEYVRIYMATLKPGQETLYHSHHEDTLYKVIKGGKISTITHRLDQKCPNRLLNQYTLKYKLHLIIGRIKKKAVYLEDGFSFYMPSGSKKVVHKACASIENKEDMQLLGIELKRLTKLE